MGNPKCFTVAGDVSWTSLSILVWICKNCWRGISGNPMEEETGQLEGDTEWTGLGDFFSWPEYRSL
jgi:hypothetical protein